ncbi:hypothetical protein WN943_024582 [Citrus x changshan-huyou]
MGICNSCESTNVATAKVILHDGRLQEFAYPVRVSQVLEKNPMSFVCNMDDMDFDTFLSGINGDEMLQPGRLYFALPVSWLKSPLRGEKMVSLAVKASLALNKMRGGRGKCCGCVVKKDDFWLDFSTRVLGSSSPKIVVGGGGDGSGGSTLNRKGRGGREMAMGRAGEGTNLPVPIPDILRMSPSPHRPRQNYLRESSSPPRIITGDPQGSPILE